MITELAVVIPAADEQGEIGGCLESVYAAVQHLWKDNSSLAVHVVVVLDGCTDGTAAAVAAFPAAITVLSSARCVGSARRQGADQILASRLPAGLWLANTDADCRVPVNWLTDQVAAAEAGAELVVGTVVPGPGLPAEVERAWHRGHDAGENHLHVHGANLGIAADLYERIGGWHDLAVHEDVDLVDRALAARAATVRTGAIPVVTSSRLDGRAPAGFAAHLRGLVATVVGGVEQP